MKAYVLIGTPNTRKSTLIRCLTGTYNRNKRDILLSSGKQIVVYARTTSLQSIHTTCDDFIEEIQRTRLSNQDGILFSLWPKAHPANEVIYPDALTYLNILAMEGCHIHRVVVLNPEDVNNFNQYQVMPVSDVRNQPINLTAAKIRKFFDWI